MRVKKRERTRLGTGGKERRAEMLYRGKDVKRDDGDDDDGSDMKDALTGDPETYQRGERERENEKEEGMQEEGNDSTRELLPACPVCLHGSRQMCCCLLRGGDASENLKEWTESLEAKFSLLLPLSSHFVQRKKSEERISCFLDHESAGRYREDRIH